MVAAGLSVPGNELPHGWYPVAAYGMAVGDIDYDIERFGDGYRLSPRHMRCEQFRIAKMFRIKNAQSLTEPKPLAEVRESPKA